MSKTIYILDDEEMVRNMIRVIMGDNKNYDTETFENPDECIRYLESSGEVPDIIITDYQMSLMDGIEFIDYLRERPQYKNIPVLLMSAKDSDEVLPLIEGKTGISFLQKPLGMKELLNSVSEMLDE